MIISNIHFRCCVVVVRELGGCSRNGHNTTHLVFWGPRSFQFDLEININIYYMHYIIKEDYWRP